MMCGIALPSNHNIMADASEEPQNLFLLPCAICSRTFRPEVLERHEKVCEKTLTKKRKTFDSHKFRVQGTDLEEFYGPPPLPGQQPRAPPKKTPKPPEKKKPKWKETHEALVATLRAARGEQVPTTTSTTTLMAAENEQCMTCGRHFGPRAYDRHVEFCKELMARKPKTPAKNDPAQNRQQARLQYRAPLSNKRPRPETGVSKINRPQSLPLPEPSTTQVKRTVTTAPAQRTQRLPPATTPMKTPQSPSASRTVEKALTRVGSTRGSLRLRGVSPAKTSLQRKPSVRESEAKDAAEKERTFTYEAADDGKPKKKTNTEISSEGNKIATPKGMRKKNTMEAIMAAADRQMRELLSWSSDKDLAAHSKPIHPHPSKPRPSPTQSHSSDSSRSDLVQKENPDVLPRDINTKTTPKSPKAIRATPSPKFPKISSPKRASPLHASPTSAFSPVVSRNNNNSLDENFNSLLDSSEEKYCPLTSTPKSKSGIRESPPVERPSSLISQASNLIDEDLWSQIEAQIQPLTRNRKKTFARSTSVFDDRNRMLYLQTFIPDSSEEDDITLLGRPRPSERRFETQKSCVPKIELVHDDGANEALKDLLAAGGDSAYSSLNRRSPVSKESSQRKPSTFCHECGCMYPVLTAKFCCSCGVQRLFIAP